MLFNSAHPARRARTTAGFVGLSTYVGLVVVIAVDAESGAPIDLAATLGGVPAGVAQSATGLDLSGGAVPASVMTVPEIGGAVGADAGAPEVTTITEPTTAPVETTVPVETTAPPTSQPAETTAPEPTQPPPSETVSTETTTTLAPTTQPVETTTTVSNTTTTSGAT